MQGLQDLTSYAKKSEIEDVAVANVKFAQSEIAQENSISFDKTITYANGREATTVDDLAILPATPTKAGVMSATDKVKLDAVDGRIQGVKIYESSTDGFIIQNAEYDNLKATIGTDVLIESAVNIRTGANIGVNAELSNNAQIKRNVLIYEEVEIGNNATIGTDAIGTSLIQIRNNYAGKIAIGNGVQIAKGVGISVDDDCNLVFGREIQGSYQMKTAATADDFSALATRVSVLEDLLKLA